MQIKSFRNFGLSLGLLFLVGLGQTPALHAGVRIGIGVGVPIVIAPAPVAVYVGPAPIVNPNEVWIPGQNQWNGSVWVWYPGHYAYLPYAGAVWLGGDWGYSGGSRIWLGGHWNHGYGNYGHGGYAHGSYSHGGYGGHHR